MAFNFWQFIRADLPHGAWQKDAPYMDAVQYLEQNTEPGSIIGMTGGGNIGYFIHDRTIVNMDGLINSSDYFQALKQRRAGVYLSAFGMNYVFANRDIITSIPYGDNYDAYLGPSKSVFGGKELMEFRAPK